MKLRKAKGFTLIELMIVVAIIGILAAIAIPKFADLIRKSKEGSSKGNLGSLRSALTIYYSENEYYPTDTGIGTGAGVLSTKYIEAIPSVDLGTTAYGHSKSSTIEGRLSTVAPDHDGNWDYSYVAAEGSGSLMVDCSHTDTKGTTISVW